MAFLSSGLFYALALSSARPRTDTQQIFKVGPGVQQLYITVLSMAKFQRAVCFDIRVTSVCGVPVCTGLEGCLNLSSKRLPGSF